ncbi:DUF262 domain-containing protein [Campylobacter sp. JMF_04 NA10]|uniref:DUF262 domain-containing protein n=1 Tax=Campylobacter sp. JMF_04 NA10 TaxID=2983824 RepID=UPI0022E9E59F|nr:DUF262 domain-containing protein [Campylobacter sp. JMF_04 NA10]MDA3076584.1 DUF262 domain-containing protein [Campylobacter sp. JMF_04 NA10]
MSNNIRNFKELMIGNKEKNIKPMTIEIPMLQRDYAQGREETKTAQIRERFLTSIFEVLSGKKANLHLEFIYGSAKDGKFIPLDGQQRLTTLFLLHWYFGFGELKDGEKKSKFRYETRASSREFCNMMVNLNCEVLKNNEKISAQIKDDAKFLAFWQNDPTVKSMLNMLDAIHEKAKGKNLNKENLNKIDFDFLNMGEFGLSDELYIKMNARGKGLTEFENFKAKFEDLLEKEKFRHLLRYFKNKIDKDWAEKFWEFRDKKEEENPADSADKAFMRYFYFISEMLFYKSNENSQKEAKDDKKVEFDKREALKIYENSQENIEFLFSALDNVNEIEKYANEIFKEVPIYWGKQDTNKDTDIKQFLMKIEKGYYEKVIYFIIISNYQKENTKYLVRQARNIMCSIKQPDGRGGVTYKSNLRAQDIYSILNFIDGKEINFTKNKELFEEKNNISKNLKDIEEIIFKLEDSEIIQGDLGAVYKAYGNNVEKYSNLLNNVNNIFDKQTKAVDILGMLVRYENIDFIYHGDTNIGNKYYIGSGLKDCWNFVFSNNNDKYKDIIDLFAQENLNPKTTCERYIMDCENQQKRDWRYYFVKYREIFFKETDIKFNVDYKGKFKKEEKENEYRNVFIIKEYRNKFEIEKMGGLSVGIYYTHINPFIYCAVIKNIEKEFDKEINDRKYFIKYGDNSYSYAAIENFIEKLYCLDDGWHIEFVGNFDFSTIKDKLKPNENPNENPNEFILAHDPNSDTIENLKNLLKNLAQI